MNESELTPLQAQALFEAKKAEKRSRLLDVAKGGFSFGWRDAISASVFGLMIFFLFTDFQTYKWMVGLNLCFLFFDAMTRIARAEQRLEAMSKLLLED